jgi:O-glycosyl hydrolase
MKNMGRIYLLALVLMLAIFQPASMSSSALAVNTPSGTEAVVSKTYSSTVNIDAYTQYQTIEDFGASDCWFSDIVGKNWDSAQKEDIARKLFSQNFDADGNPLGIGLSNWRVNIGGGTSSQDATTSNISDELRRADCFLKQDGTYDWTHCAGQQYFMQRAKEYGCSDFTLFSNTPPIYFTKNGKGCANSGETGSNLNDDKYDDFAEFLATVGKHFTDAGYHVSYISPVNEPQWDWTNGQEGSPWQNENIAKLAREMNASLQSRSSDIKILLSESGSWEYAYGGSGRASNQIFDFFDSSSTDYIGNLPSLAKAFGAHSYWTYSTNDNITNYRSKAWKAANTYGLRTLQTEWCTLGDAPSTSTGFPASYDVASYMDIALFMAKLIQCDLTITNVSSWSYWTALGSEVYGQKNRYYLLHLTPRDGDYGSFAYSGTVAASKNLWALGNFSLFVRPDYKRIGMSGADDMNGVLGSSYMSPDSSKIVSVYVNMATNEGSVNVNFSGLNGREPYKVNKYVTDSSHDLTLDASASGLYSGAAVKIPARSVVTVVYEIGDPAVILDENTAFTNPESPTSAQRVQLQMTLKSGWNAVCLPLSMTEAQVTSSFGEGAKVAHFTGFEGGDIQFSTARTSLNANEPVLLYVPTAGNVYSVMDVNISTVTLPSNTMTFSNNGESLSFIGVYQPTSDLYSQYGGSADLYTVSASQLQKVDASSSVAVKSFNAFFSNKNPLQPKTTIIVDGSPTPVRVATIDNEVQGAVYDLSGRLVLKSLSDGTLKKGIYIVNGKKYIMK